MVQTEETAPPTTPVLCEDDGVRITLDPHRPGIGRARLDEYGVPIWALIAYMGGDEDQIERTAADYDLPESVVRAAVNFYRAHRGPIDALIETQIAAAR